jgi:hypothetical protein
MLTAARPSRRTAVCAAVAAASRCRRGGATAPEAPAAGGCHAPAAGSRRPPAAVMAAAIAAVAAISGGIWRVRQTVVWVVPAEEIWWGHGARERCPEGYHGG